jgi:hypothetical protein
LLLLAEQSRAVGELIETGPTGSREQLSKVTGDLSKKERRRPINYLRTNWDGCQQQHRSEEQPKFKDRSELSRTVLSSVRVPAPMSTGQATSFLTTIDCQF